MEVMLMKKMEVIESSKGTTREKTLQEVLRDEKNHIETITKVITRWKEIYHNLPMGTTIHSFVMISQLCMNLQLLKLGGVILQ